METDFQHPLSFVLLSATCCQDILLRFTISTNAFMILGWGMLALVDWVCWWNVPKFSNIPSYWQGQQLISGICPSLIWTTLLGSDISFNPAHIEKVPAVCRALYMGMYKKSLLKNEKKILLHLQICSLVGFYWTLTILQLETLLFLSYRVASRRNTLIVQRWGRYVDTVKQEIW